MVKHVSEVRKSGRRLFIAVSLGLLLVSRVASAQQIGGTVTDSSGAALPGVTVEVSSPALIEKVRTAVSDGSGQYLIVGLVPGTYSVKFGLTGFSNVVREGVQLTTGFAANINAELSVGAVAETITVSGTSPVVDIQNISKQQVMNREVIDSIPTGKSLTGYGLLIPGMSGPQHLGSSLSQDTGGTTVQNRQRLVIHGSQISDQQLEVNGLDVGDVTLNGTNLAFLPDTNMQEIAFNYSGNPAQTETGGVRINMIPKEGGNRFTGSVFGTFSTPTLHADNLDEELISQGIDTPNKIDQVWSFNPNFGGPLVRDRLWFFAAHAQQRSFLFPSGVYNDVNPRDAVFVPNRSERALEKATAYEQSINMTWQATSKDKFKGYWSNSRTYQDTTLLGRTLGSIFVTPEASIKSVLKPNIYQGTWVRPQTNRLLFEAGVSHEPIYWAILPPERAVLDLPGVLEVAPSIVATRSPSGYNAGANYHYSPKRVTAFNAAASYVTGSHNIKVGMNGLKTWNETTMQSDLWMSEIVFNGVPIQASYYASGDHTEIGTTLGLYAQDQWRIGRMTVNAGLRFDNPRQGYPDQVRPPNRWVAREFAVTGDTVTNWKDIQPRIGVAYDLFGNGKTALKASASRYGMREGLARAAAVNPASANREQQRAWYDGGDPFGAGFPACLSGTCIAGDGIPQGDPNNPAPNGELFSPNTNLAFGEPRVVVFYDEDWAKGWGNRASHWETNAIIEHELKPGFSVTVGYFNRQYVNLDAVDNRAVGPNDYDTFQVTVPNDPLLPESVRGSKLTLVDLKPTSIRPPDLVTTSANNFGGRSSSWQGVDMTTAGRLKSLFVQGGVTVGSASTDTCAVLEQLPESLRQTGGLLSTALPREYCKTRANWQPNVKLLGSYSLPYDLQVAATLQNAPGPERLGSVTFTADQIRAALGRPSTQGQYTLNVIPPGTDFGQRFSQFDLRFTKVFRFGGNRLLRGMFDIFNVMNSNAITAEVPTVGPSYLIPQGIMPGRLAKFAVQVDF